MSQPALVDGADGSGADVENIDDVGADAAAAAAADDDDGEPAAAL